HCRASLDRFSNQCVKIRAVSQHKGSKDQRIKRVAPSATLSPMMTPINTISMVSRRTRPTTSLLCAPSAIRMPIPCVLRETVENITPYTLTEAGSSAGGGVEVGALLCFVPALLYKTPALYDVFCVKKNFTHRREALLG